MRYTFCFAITLITVSQGYSYSALSLGFEGGFAPNFMEMDRQFEGLQLADDRINQKATEVRDYYGDRVKISDIRSSGGELVGIPLGVNVRYVYNRLFFKLGFLYHVVLPNYKSYVLNTKQGVDPQLTGGRNFYNDYALNADNDILNNVPQAYGLMKTNGKDVLYQSYTRASVWEVPFTVGFVLVGKEYYKFYIGAGMSFFTGTSSRTITVNEKIGEKLIPLSGPNSGADVDEFQGSSVGFHFLLGSEFQVTRKVGIYGEFSYSIGAAVPLLDRIRTGADTTTSLFHAAQITDQSGLDEPGSEVPGPVTKAGVPRVSGLSFRYFRFSLGISYNILINRPPKPKFGGSLDKL